METLRTNQDFYQALCVLGNEHNTEERSLEQYLLTLLELSRPMKQCECLQLPAFYKLLSGSFTASTPPFEDAWRRSYGNVNDDAPGYTGWCSTLMRQIVDLREMDEAGSLQNEQRYFGVKSPSGSNWYNFNPGSYLECATAGALGGWEPDAASGRQFVPGGVAVMDNSGKLQIMKPAEIERPIVQMPTVTWDLFRDFLICGQIYE
jgi:hypothetical protein